MERSCKNINLWPILVSLNGLTHWQSEMQSRASETPRRKQPRVAKAQKKRTVKVFMMSLQTASREALKWCWPFEYFDRSDGTVSLTKLYILFICAAPPLTSRWPFWPPWNLNELGHPIYLGFRFTCLYSIHNIPNPVIDHYHYHKYKSIGRWAIYCSSQPSRVHWLTSKKIFA